MVGIVGILSRSQDFLCLPSRRKATFSSMVSAEAIRKAVIRYFTSFGQGNINGSP